MTKKTFKKPELEVIEIKVEEVIATSGVFNKQYLGGKGYRF